MTQKTVLTELIEDIDLIIEATQASPRFSESVKTVTIGTLKTLKNTIIIKKLPKERQDLIDFHIETIKKGLIAEGDKKRCDSYEPLVIDQAEQCLKEKFGI